MINAFFHKRSGGKDPAVDYTFVDHLEDLRWVLLRSLVGVGLCSVVGFVYIDFFFDSVIMGATYESFPTYRLMCWLSDKCGFGERFCMHGIDVRLQSTRMSGQFFMSFSVALCVGIVLAFPYVVYQIWQFVKPALTAQEIRQTCFIVLPITVLFLVGLGFGYFILSPYSIQFFTHYSLSPRIENRFVVSDFVSVVLQLSLGSAVLFELPFVVYVLAKLGLVSSRMLKRSKKYAFLIILVVAAVITPPDVFSQLIISAPVYLLYECSIFIARYAERKSETQ